MTDTAEARGSEMLAARLHVPTRELRLQYTALPSPAAGEVRIKVMAAGVCLSDLHLIDGTLSPVYLRGDEVTLGHEVAGTIDALGPGVRGWKVGDRVLLLAGEEDHNGRVLTRGVDYDGGWAEFACASTSTLVPLPDGLPFEQACIIPDAVSTPWAAVTTTARVTAGTTVGVWGIGGLGSHAVQLLRLIGAAPIIAIDPQRDARSRAAAAGADLTLDPGQADFSEQLQQVTGGRGLDVALDFAGAPSAREQALQSLGLRGRLVIVGLSHTPITVPNDVWFAYMQQQVLGAYGSDREHVEQLVRLVGSGRLDLTTSVSALVPLAEVAEAVQRVVTGEENLVRLVLVP